MPNGVNRMFCALLCAFATQAVCLPAAAIQLFGNLGIHDPSRIHQQDGRYYVFATGSTSSPIRVKYSDNFTQWQDAPNGLVFTGIPAWAEAEVPNNPGFAWAPSVIHFNGEYRLYYSVSSFGSKNSVIGLATNTTLDFNDPGYQWVDQEMVIESESFPSSVYPYNAIDPGIFYDEDTERMWMTWGSFWNGIYITELDPDTGKRITPDSRTINIADRAQGSAIEAPFLMKRDDYYYLFVNWDSCCDGVNSTYNIRVGRGTSPTGPFYDRSGDAMIDGGGDLFLGTEDNFIGPGHFAHYSEDGRDYFGYHYYDGNDGGNARYAIEEFVWTSDDWPVRLALIPAGDYNHNGIVDAADYTVWRDTLGSTTDLRANGNNIRGSAGVIDQADYDFWRAKFGDSIGGGSGAAQSLVAGTIPEPSSLCFAAMAASVLALYHREKGVRSGPV